MDTIGEQQISTFLSGSDRSSAARCTQIRRDKGHLVANYMELATKIAELQFMNRDYVLALGVGCALMAVLIFAAAIFPSLGKAVVILR